MPLGALLLPLVLGGAIFVFRRVGRQRVHAIRPPPKLNRRTQWILGKSRHEIAGAIGLPHASAGAAAGAAAVNAPFLADQWYYRLDSRRHIAIAIEFDRDIASSVRTIQMPRTGVMQTGGWSKAPQ